MQKRTVLLDLNVNLGFGGNKVLCNVFILGGQHVAFASTALLQVERAVRYLIAEPVQIFLGTPMYQDKRLVFSPIRCGFNGLTNGNMKK